MKESGFRGAFDMVDNPGLIFFYVSQFMQDCVFYCPNLHAYAIAELEEGNLLLHNIFSPKADLEDVIKAFGCQVTQVQLGFAPDDSIGWGKELLVEEDTTLFVKGDVFTRFEEMQLRVPTLSHA